MTNFKIYLITDRHKIGDQSLVDVVRQALEGGVRSIQLREKGISTLQLYQLAAKLRNLTDDFGATFIINDRLDVAVAVNADGVHIGVNSLPVAKVRQILGADKIIGYSAHSIAEALEVEADGADFVTFSPVYTTKSKPSDMVPCGVEKLAEAVSLLKIPVIALGGISYKNISEVISTNIHGIAVISSILSAADPKASAANLLEKIEEYDKHP